MNFDLVQKYLKEHYDYKIEKSKKIVMVGDHLTTDIAFGNLNDFATVWVRKF